MKLRSRISTKTVLSVVGLMICTSSAISQNLVYQCVEEDGTRVFSDPPCTSDPSSEEATIVEGEEPDDRAWARAESASAAADSYLAATARRIRYQKERRALIRERDARIEDRRARITLTAYFGRNSQGAGHALIAGYRQEILELERQYAEKIRALDDAYHGGASLDNG